jgi:hypothetical protein
MVLGGVVGSTESEVETKVPILGDLPLIGNLFRGSRNTARRTNLLIFLTPHIIDSQDDIEEVMRIKMAQRSEFERRFYGKSQAEQEEALQDLLSYSMNFPDRDSEYVDQAYTPASAVPPRQLTDEEAARYMIPGSPTGQTVPGVDLEDETRRAIEEALAVPVEPRVEPTDGETEGE